MKNSRVFQFAGLAIAFASAAQLATKPGALATLADSAPAAFAGGAMFLLSSLAAAGLLVVASRVWRRMSR